MQTDKMAFTVEEQEPQKITFEVGNTQYITDTNYNSLKNKPKINGVELTGNKTLEELGIGLGSFEKVDVLPEVGTSNVIYLVPIENPKDKNIYNEYIYTNEKWEIIGSTDIDLTGYVTNEQLAEELKNAGVPMFVIKKTQTNDKITEIINEAIEYHKTGKPYLFKLIDNQGDEYNVQIMALYDNEFRVNVNGISGQGDIYYYWYASVYYASSYNLIKNFEMWRKKIPKDAISMTNTTSYNVTNDYQPAHKKYVDEVVATALENTPSGDFKELGGEGVTVASWEQEEGIYKVLAGSTLRYYSAYSKVLSNGTALLIVTDYDEEYKSIIIINYANNEVCFARPKIATGGGLYVYHFGLSQILSKNNSSSYTVQNDYQPAHKKYVDDTIATALENIPSGETFPVISESGIELWKLDAGQYYIANNTMVKFNNSGSSYNMGDGWLFLTKDTLRANGIIIKTGDAENDEKIVTFSTALSNGYGHFINNYYLDYLPKNNTTEFTPTGDYNPATKKYVDETIANAGGAPIYFFDGDVNSDENKAMFAEIVEKIENNEPYTIYYGNKGLTYHGLLLGVISHIGNYTFRFLVANSSDSTQYGKSYGVEYLSCRINEYQYNPTQGTLKYLGNPASSLLRGAPNFLGLSNTTEFVPTGDYNPATKKYVDDQVGDINTILATLTTVEEVAE